MQKTKLQMDEKILNGMIQILESFLYQNKQMETTEAKTHILIFGTWITFDTKIPE